MYIHWCKLMPSIGNGHWKWHMNYGTPREQSRDLIDPFCSGPMKLFTTDQCYTTSTHNTQCSNANTNDYINNKENKAIGNLCAICSYNNYDALLWGKWIDVYIHPLIVYIKFVDLKSNSGDPCTMPVTHMRSAVARIQTSDLIIVLGFKGLPKRTM